MVSKADINQAGEKKTRISTKCTSERRGNGSFKQPFCPLVPCELSSNMVWFCNTEWQINLLFDVVRSLQTWAYIYRARGRKKNKIGAGANSASRCLLMAPWLDLLFTSACQQHNGRKTCQCDDHAHSTWSLALPHTFLVTAVKAMQNRLLEEKTSVFNGTNDLHCGQSA